MKAKKLVGAIALTAALAMGTTMPAFATTWHDAGGPWNAGVSVGDASASDKGELANITDNTKDDKKAQGSTEVYASVYDADVNVTVPVAIAIAFAADGDSAIKAPTNYTVTNNFADTKDVYIRSITGTGTGGFALGSVTGATTNTLQIMMDGNQLGSAAINPHTLLNATNPSHTFDFTGSQAHVASPLTVGYLASAVANITIEFGQKDII